VTQALPAAKGRSVTAINQAPSVRDSEGSECVRVFVVDDDRLFREALAELLRAHGLDVVGTATGAEKTIAANTRKPRRLH